MPHPRRAPGGAIGDTKALLADNMDDIVIPDCGHYPM
jgi:hypothetical protein